MKRIIYITLALVVPFQINSEVSRDVLKAVGITGALTTLGCGIWAICEHVQKKKTTKELNDYKSKKIERDEAHAVLVHLTRIIERARMYRNLADCQSHAQVVQYLKVLLEQEQLQYSTILRRCHEDVDMLKRMKIEIPMKSENWKRIMPDLERQAQELNSCLDEALLRMNRVVSLLHYHAPYMQLIECYTASKPLIQPEIALSQLISSRAHYHTFMQQRITEASVSAKTPFMYIAYAERLSSEYTRLNAALTEVLSYNAEQFQKEYIAQIKQDVKALKLVLDTILASPEYARELREKPIFEAEERRKQQTFEQQQALLRAEEARIQSENEAKRVEEQRKKYLYDLERQRIAAQIEDSHRIAEAAVKAQQPKTQIVYVQQQPPVPSAPTLEEIERDDAPPAYSEPSYGTRA